MTPLNRSARIWIALNEYAPLRMAPLISKILYCRLHVSCSLAKKYSEICFTKGVKEIFGTSTTFKLLVTIRLGSLSFIPITMQNI